MPTDEFPQDPFRKMVPSGDDNPFQDNPYVSPDLQSGTVPGELRAPHSALARRGMVGHVPTVAILMIVQGTLESLMGLMFIGMGAFMALVMRDEMAQPERPLEGPTPEAISWILLAVYGGIGLLVAGGAVLHIVAGIRNYRFRSRLLGIVALIAGMATTMVTCYCAPTAIALGVYGLICYLNPEVTHAFALAAAGRTKQEILEAVG